MESVEFDEQAPRGKLLPLVSGFQRKFLHAIKIYLSGSQPQERTGTKFQSNNEKRAQRWDRKD